MQFFVIDQVMFGMVMLEEWVGYDLFKLFNGVDCFYCYNGLLIQVQCYVNNGFDLVFVDLGWGVILGVILDIGKFKIFLLCNVEFSGFYMYDGCFVMFDDVIEYYFFGVVKKLIMDLFMEYVFQYGVLLIVEEK